MQTLLVVSIAMLATLWLSSSAHAAPEGWHLAGSAPGSYESGSDAKVKKSGKSSGYLKSKEKSISGFGTLMQTLAPDKYAGKRVRLSAVVKADKVKDWAGLWMRVDGEGTTPLAFDNMQGRAIKGTSNWKRYEVVLDVPKKATAVAFGILLSGTGSVWIDNVKLETVSKSTPITGGSGATLPTSPQNPGFDK